MMERQDFWIDIESLDDGETGSFEKKVKVLMVER